MHVVDLFTHTGFYVLGHVDDATLERRLRKHLGDWWDGRQPDHRAGPFDARKVLRCYLRKRKTDDGHRAEDDGFAFWIFLELERKPGCAKVTCYDMAQLVR